MLICNLHNSYIKVKNPINRVYVTSKYATIQWVVKQSNLGKAYIGLRQKKIKKNQ